MSLQFLATEATLFLSGGSSDGLQPRKVQWSDQQQPRMTSAPPMSPPVKPPARGMEAEVTRTPGPVTPVQSRTKVGSPGSLGTPEQLTAAAPGLGVHPDILAVLSWQKEQLTALQVSLNLEHDYDHPHLLYQDQVARLMEASPARQPTHIQCPFSGGRDDLQQRHSRRRYGPGELPGAARGGEEQFGRH